MWFSIDYMIHLFTEIFKMVIYLPICYSCQMNKPIARPKGKERNGQEQAGGIDVSGQHGEDDFNKFSG